jgi:cytochrome c553
MRKAPVLFSLLALLGATAPGFAQNRPAQAASCDGCHGAAAQAAPQAPRLNGQTREYLAARLNELRNPGNQTVSAIHAMLGPVRQVSDATKQALAGYYAAQAPTPPAAGAGAERSRGAILYARGDGTRLPACAGCHGAQGEGAGINPRLAGQHAAYLQDQMEALMLTARLQPGMNKHVWGIRPEEIRALAAFLGNG